MTSLRFSPDILKRLGEELNPNPDQGILELVKNAHDADASTCTVTIVERGASGRQIVVEDDGDGMDRAGIAGGWLVLGRSRKDSAQRTRLGRVPAGSKGLGRLAALRLGKRVELETRPRKEPGREYRITIDWDAFDRAAVVEEVDLKIESGAVDRKRGFGTTIKISGIKRDFSRWEVKRLARGMIMLANPFEQDELGFKPRLVAAEFEDLARLVSKRYFEDADFHLEAALDAKGKASAAVRDWKGRVLYQASHEDLRLKDSATPYEAPKARFDLWAFVLTSESFVQRASSLKQVREWLGEFGGVHLYIRSLRVSPYGDSGHDWLDMNLSRVRSPELRPSTNTAIGRIEIEDLDSVLVQKTDRTGLVETPSFQALRDFAKDALDWLARKRLDERERHKHIEKRASAEASKLAAKQVAETIQELKTPKAMEAKQVFEQFVKQEEKVKRVLEKEVNLYRTVSTAGVAAATFSHETEHPIIDIITNNEIVRRRTKKSASSLYESDLKEPLERIDIDAKTLQAHVNSTLDLLEADKRRVGRVDVHPAIKNRIEAFTPLAQARGVKLVPSFCPGKPFLRATAAGLESVVTNLIVNAIKALEGVQDAPKRIEISTTRVGESLEITCSDSGPGIRGISVADIWLPGETTRENGTGLGLAIVRDTVRDLGGECTAQANGPLGGATIRCSIPMDGW